ncbi:MAG: nucleotidyl transferase AbiEii/AbiGii toxin family protein, partial [Gammaproteobacteria bacterium]
AKNTLRKKINTIINSTPFSQILQTKKIIISNISEPKQTETTQRWKITLKFSNISIELPTKIEFSRRDFNNNVLFQPIDPIIISEYFLRPILVNHYPMEIAFQQKILALMHRTQTQARDVFDLYHLICLGEKGIFHDKNIINNLSIAQENMLTLKFKDFKSQVLAYLPESYKKVYDSEEIWHSMIKAISEKLEKAQQ